MGEIQKITCTKCDKSWECKTGCGLLHGRIDYISPEFPDDIQQKIKADISKHPLSFFDFAYQLASCPHCRNIVSIPVLSIDDSDSVYVAPCPECGTVIPTGESLTCPICHDAPLTIEKIGGWD